MSFNSQYVDIYSHSSHQNIRKTKSRGRLKSILCFLLCITVFISMLAMYCLGVYVEQIKSKNTVDTNKTYLPSSTLKNENAEISNAIESAVGIYVYNDNSDCYASGVVISQDGYIVTADHIFKNIYSAKILVYDSSGEYYNGAFIGGDSKSDVAVIKIEKTGLKYSEITNTEVKIGESVYSIGCPMDSSLAMSVTSGVISGKDRRFTTDNGHKSIKMLQTDASINPGCSGGGLFNSFGQLVGINSSKVVDESYEGVGFAVPIETVNSVVSSIIEQGTAKSRASLGIKYDCIDYATAIKNGKHCGIIINSIKVNSGLYGLGVNPQDIIISINGKKIYDENVFLNEIEGLKIGDDVKLVIYNKDYSQYEISSKLTEEKPTTNYNG